MVVVLLALVVGRTLTQPSAPAEAPAPDALVAQVAGVPSAILDQVGPGTMLQPPVPVRAEVERGPAGQPLVTYIGAEYCPFCAAERWPLIVALGRFGTFTGLKLTHSASDDVYPNTPTFSFVGSGYSSQYLQFSPVELQSNVRSGGSYQPLQTPTPGQTNILRTYDAPPYVPVSSAGSIPFIDFAGQYIVTGASYDAGILRGMTQDQIATALDDPSTPQAKAILGAANSLTAAICSGTADTPAEACGLSAVKSFEASLAAAPVPGR